MSNKDMDVIVKRVKDRRRDELDRKHRKRVRRRRAKRRAEERKTKQEDKPKPDVTPTPTLKESPTNILFNVKGVKLPDNFYPKGVRKKRQTGREAVAEKNKSEDDALLEYRDHLFNMRKKGGNKETSTEAFNKRKKRKDAAMLKYRDFLFNMRKKGK